MVTRRNVVSGLAWSAPVVVTTFAAPAFAASVEMDNTTVDVLCVVPRSKNHKNDSYEPEESMSTSNASSVKFLVRSEFIDETATFSLTHAEGKGHYTFNPRSTVYSPEDRGYVVVFNSNKIREGKHYFSANSRTYPVVIENRNLACG